MKIKPYAILFWAAFLALGAAGLYFFSGSTVAGQAALPDGINVRINPMIELDGKTRDEIFKLRTAYVREHPGLLKFLVKGKYAPSQAVFGQIADGKTWWGILGICYYGRGEKSIEGPSEESRFIANPYLLAAACESFAQKVTKPGLKPREIYPRPVSLWWYPPKSMAIAKYDVSGYFKDAREYGFSRFDEFCLPVYNARDMGFDYLNIVPEKCRNVEIVVSSEPIANPEFLHLGTSSGYPGGSNNMSPYFPPLGFRVKALPARVHLKLWRQKPPSVKAPADFSFIIEMN
jgi:hypothetical protein